MKILLIQFKPAGDVLLLTSVVKVLKKKLQNSEITFLVNEKESVLIKDYPLIDDSILIRKLSKKGLSYIKYLMHNIEIYRNVRKKNFDAVIDFIGNPKSALITLLSGADIKIGRKLGLRSIAYNYLIEKHADNVNTVTKRLAHLKPLGIDVEYCEPEIQFTENEINFARNYISGLTLPPNTKIVFLAPNSPRSARRWKAEYFISAGSELQKRYNAKILLLWGPGEEKYTESVMQGIKGAEMIPLTSLKEMAAIISMGNLLITNDSGPKHIANAAGVRTITINGPTNPYSWNHPDMEKNPAVWAEIPCIRCERRVCPLSEHLCMEKVTPDMVIAPACRILDES